MQRAVHQPTGTPLALKVLNMYDKGKRDQLIKEVQALYNANCDWYDASIVLCPAQRGVDRACRACSRSLVQFYGAFHKEGAISIALEYMDGGALSDVLKAVSMSCWSAPCAGGW